MRSRLSPFSAGMMDGLRARAFAHLDARLTRDDPAPVALALSGGGDSLALLRLAAEWCAGARRSLLALTVDHGLHPASAGWTRFAAARAAAAGAAWRPLAWRGDKPVHGLAAAARGARHRLLAAAARDAGARVVLLGHTADDVLEGERMRVADAPTLGRLRTWGPSPVWPEGRGLALLRPLLGIGRAELRAWLADAGEPTWVEDPANDDPASPRARARRAQAVGPSLPPPQAPPELAELAAAAHADAGGGLGWDAARLRAASPTTRIRALAAAAVCVGGGERPPRGERAAAFARCAVDGRTLAGARLWTDGREVRLARAPPRRPGAPGTLHGATAWDGRFEVVADAAGWRVDALAGHAARLPPGDRRALAALPAAVRPMLPVLLDAAGRPRLPRPLGDGPGLARSLVGPRLRLALGAIATEAELAAA